MLTFVNGLAGAIRDGLSLYLIASTYADQPERWAVLMGLQPVLQTNEVSLPRVDQTVPIELRELQAA